MNKEAIKKLFTPSTIYLMFKSIKTSLGVKNSKKLKELLDKLVSDTELYFDKNTNRYYQPEYFKLVTLITACCNNFEGNFNYDDILAQLGNIDEEILKKIISILESDGIIYNFDGQNYCNVLSDFFNTKILQLFTKEELISITYIKKALHTKMDNKVLLKVLRQLEEQGKIFYDNITHFYYLIPSKEFTDKLKEFLINSPKGISLNDLKNKLSLSTPDKIILSTIKKLEKESIIYFDEEENKFFPVSNNHLVIQVESSKKGVLYITIDDTPVFLPDEMTQDILPFDTVLLEKNDNSYKLIKILKRTNEKIVCEITEKGLKVVGNSTFKVRMDKKILKDLRLPVGTRILCKLSNYDINHNYRVDYLETLGHKNDLDAELDAIAYNNGFITHYSKEELDQVASLPTEVRDEDKLGRIDLTNERIFTIDSSHTKDMDDAISIKRLDNGNYSLLVAIAAVNHYIKFASPLWLRAEQNTTSLYMIDHVSHMLHYIVSNGICSLNPGVERLAKTFKMEIDQTGNIVDLEILDTVIKSKKKMTYEEVNQILEKNVIPEGYEEFLPDLLLMQELSQILTERHKKEGSVDFDSKEIRFIIGDEEDNKSLDIEVVKQGLAEKLIENFMVATNEAVANYMLNLGIVFIYRNHEIPFDQKVLQATGMIKSLGYKVEKIRNSSNPHLLQKMIQSLRTKEEFFILSALLLKSMKKAYYSTENRGHYALALNGYSQTTSPIRRFLDLLIQYILDNIETISDPNFDIDGFKEYCSKMCERASTMERMAKKAEYEADKLYMVNYCAANPNQEYIGFVSEITSRYIIVKTKELIEGIVYFDDINSGNIVYNPDSKWLIDKSTNERIGIGTKLTLALKDYSKEYRTLYFSGKTPERVMQLTRTKN